jgi:glycosyltransferase involved in cell wall biosynthesis
MAAARCAQGDDDVMRVLWAKANKILPVSSGGDIRSFHLLRQLAASEQVTLFSYYDGDIDRQYEADLEKQLPGCICVSSGKKLDSKLARGMDYLRRLPQDAPYAVSRFASGRVRDRLRRAIYEMRPDVVVCDFLDAAINFPKRLPVPSALFQHNVESEIWRRRAETESSPLRKQILKREYNKMVRYEKVMVARFDRIIAVSEHDRSLMSRWVDASRIEVVPTGVDLSQFQSTDHCDSSSRLVVFVGAMDWEPNIDAAEYFCATVWPNVIAKVPGARFRIVGRNPDARLRKLEGPNIEVTGSVPSVVSHLRHAAVVVVPLRIGGGTRLKIYEAMAAGRAVVSTTIGAEGLDINPGKDIWIADQPREIANAMTQLLEDGKLRERFGRAAAEHAAKFDWSVVAGRFRQVLAKSARVTSEATVSGELVSAGVSVRSR